MSDRQPVRSPLPEPAAPRDELCTCGHPLAGHDAVGARYCRATTASALKRGCICLVSSVDADPPAAGAPASSG